MTTWTQFQRSQKSYRAGRLNPFDQLFMFLHKLRVGSMNQDLADKFAVSQSTVSRNTITWADVLYFVLGSQPLWLTRAQVQYFMPNLFKQHFPDTCVVTDCTEIAVQSPSSLLLKSELLIHHTKVVPL